MDEQTFRITFSFVKSLYESLDCKISPERFVGLLHEVAEGESTLISSPPDEIVSVEHQQGARMPDHMQIRNP